MMIDNAFPVSATVLPNSHGSIMSTVSLPLGNTSDSRQQKVTGHGGLLLCLCVQTLTSLDLRVEVKECHLEVCKGRHIKPISIISSEGFPFFLRFHNFDRRFNSYEMPSQASTPGNVIALLPKLLDADSDIRYMSLNDLHKVLQVGAPNFLVSDYHTSTKAADGLLKTLDDQNGEVQNQAIKWFVSSIVDLIPITADQHFSLGALVIKLPADTLPPVLEKISNLETSNSVDNSIRASALRTFITAFPPPLSGVPPSKRTQDAYNAISKVLVPRLVGYVIHTRGLKNNPPAPKGLLEVDPKAGVDTDIIDVLVELLRSFGPMLQDVEKKALQKSILTILNSGRTGTVVKKKAVVAISILSVHLSDDLLSIFISNTIEGFREPGATPSKRRLLVSMVGSLVRTIPQRLGPYLKTIAPFVLEPLSVEEYETALEELQEAGAPDPETEELHEAALVALEGFLASCSNEMRIFTGDSIDAALRYVAYDPNISADDDEDAMSGAQEDSDDEVETNGVNGDNDFEEDFEEEGAMSDDDDVSWKVRRCAAKVLYTVISTRGNGDLLDSGILYNKIAPVLIKRFQEREENVRLEILAALALLIRKTGGGLLVPEAKGGMDLDIVQEEPLQSRKRRRVSNAEKDFDLHGLRRSSLGVDSPAPSPPPSSGPKADLDRCRPAVIQGTAKLLKEGSAPTQQAGVHLLRDLVLVQHGSLSDHLSKVVPPLVNVIKAGAGSTSLAAGGAGSQLRIESLQLVGTIFDTHSSKVVAPYLGSIIPEVVTAAKEKTFKVAGQALRTIESIGKALTPPRSAGAQQQNRKHIEELYIVILDRTMANEADLEVRQRAIRALGVLLSRTAGSHKAALLSTTNRHKAQMVLKDRLSNETTRLAAAQAIDMVATSAKDSEDLEKSWVPSISLELAAQFRKADRVLRGACLAALKNIVGNPVALSHLDDPTVRSLSSTLLPLVSPSDLNTLGLAMVILTRLAQNSPKSIVDDKLTQVIRSVVLAPLSGAVLDALLSLLKTIGEQGVGRSMMKGVLDVGIGGDPAIVGKAIGTLLVAGGSSVGVTIDEFIKELKTSVDPARKCLALSILGEAGLRLKQKSPLTPKLFLEYFNATSDAVPRAAAVALGRAGAGNVEAYLPSIIAASKKSSSWQYLSLHSIRELLDYSEETGAVIAAYTKEIWERLMSASKDEDNRAIGAECIGRLTVIEPETYLPLVQVSLEDYTPSVT